MKNNCAESRWGYLDSMSIFEKMLERKTGQKIKNKIDGSRQPFLLKLLNIWHTYRTFSNYKLNIIQLRIN